MTIRSKAAWAVPVLMLGMSAFATGASAQQTIQLSESAVTAAYNKITNFGKLAGAPDTRTHIFPTTQSRLTLPKSVLNRNNFHNFDLAKFMSDPSNLQKFDIAPLAPNAAAFPVAGAWNPDDLQTFGGAVIKNATQHPIYMNCAGGGDTCWVTTAGDIGKFITSLNTSTMITITNQYVGSVALHRYPLGSAFTNTKVFAKSPWGKRTMLDSDAQAIALAAATASGGFGYNHMYHIFIPSGTDACFDMSYSACYSPDHVGSFAFCGYHSSFTSGANKIIYSVEAFDHVSTAAGACFLTGQNVTDAQVSVLSHEMFETITDPDPNSGWNSKIASLGEIGDECAWHLYTVNLTGNTYHIQLEYTNQSHACAAAP